MEKRGQAALEFLMTYGWAILAVVIVVALLAAFGVFRPKAPNVCGGPGGEITSGLVCSWIKLTNDTFELSLTNNMGSYIELASVNVTQEGTNCLFTNSSSIPVLAGEKTRVTLLSSNCNLIAGTRFEGNIKVTYIKEGVEHTAKARVSGEVEE